MADINQQFINEIANNMLKPTIVDTLVCDDWDYDMYVNGEYMNYFPAKYTLKFIGYALPTCTGMDDPKWLIQLNMKVDIDISGGNMQGNNGGGGEGGFNCFRLPKSTKLKAIHNCSHKSSAFIFFPLLFLLRSIFATNLGS